MHSYTGSGGSAFAFNSDFSGDLVVFDAEGRRLTIPAQDVLELVAFKYVLPKKINKLELAEADELLTKE